MKPLTIKQERFAVEYVYNGGDAANAYRLVYDTKTDKDTTVYVSAHKLLRSPKVSQRVHELQMAELSTEIISIEERKMVLTNLAKKGDIKSIDMLNRMDGVYTEKLDITATHEVNYYAPKKDKSK